MKKILIFADIDIGNNEVTRIYWSVDIKTLAFAKYLYQKKGWDIYLLTKQYKNYILNIEINSLYNIKIIKKCRFKDAVFDLLFVPYSYIFDGFFVESVKRFRIMVKFLILSIPAIHWLEDSDNANIKILRIYSYFIRKNVDLIITTNKRMQMYLQEFWYLFIKFPKNRVKRIELGFDDAGLIDRYIARKKYIKCKEDDIVIINTGGIWGWTDFNSFLIAFIKAVRDGKKNLKLYIMGKKQKNNFEKTNIRYIQEFENIIKDNKDLLNKNIFISDWSSPDKINKFISGADVGLNVNKDTLENIFSSRVRLTDYIKAGIPVIYTFGDEMSNFFREKNIGWQVKPGDIMGYYDILKNLTHDDINRMKLKIRLIRNDFKWDNIIEKFWKEEKNIFNKPLRANAPNLSINGLYVRYSFSKLLRKISVFTKLIKLITKGIK